VGVLMVPSEDDEQMQVVQYLELRGLKFTATTNHTYTTSIKQKMHNRRIGLRAGIPDLIVVLPGAGLLFIEMKRTKNSSTTPEQVGWIEALNTCPGVEARVCKGAESAIAFIRELYPESNKPSTEF
jgi:hypothetical protein